MSAVRQLIATLLALAALLVGSGALAAQWTQQHVLDTDRWTAAVAPLIQEKSVQDEVSTALVQAMDPQGRWPARVRTLARALAGRAVATDAFAAAWADAVRISHSQLVAAIRREGTGLKVEDRRIVVELGPLFDAVLPSLSVAGVPGLSALSGIARPDGEVVLDSSASVSRTLRATRVIDRWAAPATWTAIALLVAALVIARRRAWLLGLTGASVMALAAIALLAWLAVRAIAVAGTSVSDQVIRALTDDVTLWLFLSAGAGAAALALSLVGAARRR